MLYKGMTLKVCLSLQESKRLVNHVFIFISEKRLISLCVGCGNQIHDQYILRVSPDLEWHAACLKCAECNQYLDETCTCFVRDGKTYCKRDYIRYAIYVNCLMRFYFSFDFIKEELRGKTVRKRVKDNWYVFTCFPMNRPARKKVSSEVFYLFFSNANICITRTRFGTVQDLSRTLAMHPVILTKG